MSSSFEVVDRLPKLRYLFSAILCFTILVSACAGDSDQVTGMEAISTAPPMVVPAHLQPNLRVDKDGNPCLARVEPMIARQYSLTVCQTSIEDDIFYLTQQIDDLNRRLDQLCRDIARQQSSTGVSFRNQIFC